MGPKGCLHESEAGSTGYGMRNKVCGPEEPWYEMVWAQLMLRHLAKPYFSSYECSLCHVPSNLIFHASVFWAHKPYFSYHFFERMPRPVDPTSLSCKRPSAHKPFAYQLFEFILWWRNDETRTCFENFPTFATTNHQPPTTDDNKWVTRIDRESSV